MQEEFQPQKPQRAKSNAGERYWKCFLHKLAVTTSLVLAIQHSNTSHKLPGFPLACLTCLFGDKWNRSTCIKYCCTSLSSESYEFCYILPQKMPPKISTYHPFNILPSKNLHFPHLPPDILGWHPPLPSESASPICTCWAPIFGRDTL